MSYMKNYTLHLHDLFEEWFKTECAKIGKRELAERFDQEYFYNDFDQDWEEHCIAFDLDNSNESMKEDFYELKLKEKASDFFDDFKNEFLEDIENYLDIVNDTHIKVYRKINIKKNDYEQFISLIHENKFLYNHSGIGVYWSYKKEATQCHWGKFNDGIEILLTGIIPITSVDFKRTIHANFYISLGLDEKEIRLLDADDSTINIIQINNIECDLLVSI